MGWVLTSLGVALVIVVVAGAALALRRRYCIGWKWSMRNIWSICEEWRQSLSWLWAPREEKVGLVKAQHPTGQTIPGLYRQAGNTSQHLLHSDSDLRLDAQGAFTRFESVDRDLHPPLSTINSTVNSNIPPQPLRPAPQCVKLSPQSKSTARPRPTPLQTSCTVDYIKMQDSGPLTPPPSLQRGPTKSSGPSIFIFQNEPPKSYGLHKASIDHSSFRFETDTGQGMSDGIQLSPYVGQNHVDSMLRYDLEEKRRKESNDARCNMYRQYDVESTRVRYGVHGVPISSLDGKQETEECNTSYGSYDIVQNSHRSHQHARNESKGPPGSFGMANSSNTASRVIMEAIYGSDALSKMLQSHGNDLDRKNDEMAQSIEMTPFKSSSIQNEISQYIQRLPPLPTFESMNEFAMQQDREEMLYDDGMQGRKVDSSSSPVPPPPAPPDPPKEMAKKNGLTTGERIFRNLRSVTSRSYIDASEFYNSIVSSQHIQRFNFSSRSPTLASDGTGVDQMEEEVLGAYEETDSDVIGADASGRGSDLDSPELNLEAQRTAQEVYNSLQDPPSSPLLVNDYCPDTFEYSYMDDPSITRTSEDIYRSLEESRKSFERLNGIPELDELDETGSLREFSNQDCIALEELQLKQRLSQSLEAAYITSYMNGSQGPEPEPPDESNLQRAISCESVCSDTCVVFNETEESRTVGCICIGVEHVSWIDRNSDFKDILTVSVLEARDLVAPNGQSAEDTFVRVCLLPDKQRCAETRLYRGTCSPSYHEKFFFELMSGEPTNKTLLIVVFSDEANTSGGVSLIGEASLLLEQPTQRFTTWLPLRGSALPTPPLGELMFSLSYSPTAERLTLVVVKARNLRGANPAPGEFFVKVYLIHQGKKTHKKKTSIKKGVDCPIFNESIIFSVPTNTLQNIQIRLTVAELSDEQGMNSKPYSVGHILIGATSTGRALAHWRQMLTSLRHPVGMWHPLRK